MDRLIVRVAEGGTGRELAVVEINSAVTGEAEMITETFQRSIDWRELDSERQEAVRATLRRAFGVMG